MAAITPEVLHAALGAAGKVDPNAGMAAAAGGGAAAPAGASTPDPSAAGGAPAAGGDPNAGGAAPADPMQQAVWSAFPGTDPSSAASAAQGGDIQSALSDLLQQQEQDRAKLDQMHSQLIDSILSQVSAPDQSMSTAETGNTPAIPGVGGGMGGY